MYGLALFVVLTVSLALRIQLIQRGGQYYWPDEHRYAAAQNAAHEISSGHVRQAAEILSTPDHFFFKVVAVVPALIEIRFGNGDDARLPALFFAFSSVVNIWLIGSIVRRLGGGYGEALLASMLLAMSSALFYWSRHLVPYDLAMTFGLLGLLVGVHPDGSPRRSILCGVCAGGTFLTYAGYWPLAGAVLLIHVRGASTNRARTRRALSGALGLCLSIGIAVTAGEALRGGIVVGLVAFSRTVVQGSYAEGWRLPFEYLWHAEHGLLICWLAATGWWMMRLPLGLRSPRARAGLIGVLFIYGALAAGASLFHVFVVYGRLARQLVPFFCLLTAAAAAQAGAERRRTGAAMSTVAVVALLAQTAWNFGQPIGQVFPAPLQREANDRPGVIAINTYHIYPAPERVALPAHYRVLKSAAHPLEFLPYQYEGFTPSERAVLRSTDITMRLIVPTSDDSDSP